MAGGGREGTRKASANRSIKRREDPTASTGSTLISRLSHLFPSYLSFTVMSRVMPFLSERDLSVRRPAASIQLLSALR